MAKWLRPTNSSQSSYRYKCSDCGEIVYYVTGNCGKKYKEAHPKCFYKFCPWCRADMQEESKGWYDK